MPVPTKSLGPLDPQPTFIWPWRLLIGLAFAAGFFGFVAIARADCSTIPERQASICETLGYPEPDCTPQWEGRAISAVIDFTVDSHVGEPNYISTLPAIASTVTITHEEGIASKIYQRGFLETPWGLPLLTAPCLHPFCMEKRENNPQYPGATEEDLVDRFDDALTQALWQTGDGLLQEQLRKQLGKTGTPIVIRVRQAAVFDETRTESPTRLSMHVRIRFALPAEN